MSINEELKTFRRKGYKTVPEDEISGRESEQAPVNQTPRTVVLTDEEKKGIGPVEPGTEVTLSVTGSIEQDGKFKILSVSSGAEQDDSEDEMAGQVAQKVIPSIQPSPS